MNNVKQTIVIYDIQNDMSSLEKMAKASASAAPWGIDPSNGFVGSPEWWAAIHDGRIKVLTFSGTIERLSNGAMGDTLEIYIKGADGEQGWMAWNGFNRSLLGKNVRTTYVKLPPKKAEIHRPGYLIPVLLKVEVII